jgi:hypothetical protein
MLPTVEETVPVKILLVHISVSELRWKAVLLDIDLTTSNIFVQVSEICFLILLAHFLNL